MIFMYSCWWPAYRGNYVIRTKPARSLYTQLQQLQQKNGQCVSWTAALMMLSLSLSAIDDYEATITTTASSSSSSSNPAISNTSSPTISNTSSIHTTSTIDMSTSMDDSMTSGTTGSISLKTPKTTEQMLYNFGIKKVNEYGSLIHTLLHSTWS